MFRLTIPVALLFLTSTTAVSQDKRGQQVKDDLATFNQDKYWIYNDLDRGIAKAKATGKPLLVTFR